MRIEHRSNLSTQLSLWIGVAIVVLVGFGAYKYFSAGEPEMDPSGKPYLKLVPNDTKLRGRLSDAQWKVTRENGTETAFQNQYFDNFKPGIYVDVITGEPLFSSADKFDAKTGRPTFTKPIGPDLIAERPDNSYNMQRTELRIIRSNSHLGHLFNDGPPPLGKRYAVNSAAMKFIPLENMKAMHYEDFIPLVEPTGAAAGSSPAGK